MSTATRRDKHSPALHGAYSHYLINSAFAQLHSEAVAAGRRPAGGADDGDHRRPRADWCLERLQASNAEVVQEPTQQPSGIRDCAFRDPAGNLIQIQKLP
jgi:hypothetical protein